MAWGNNDEAVKQRRANVLNGIFPDIQRASEIIYSPYFEARGEEQDRLCSEWRKKESRKWYKATNNGTEIYFIRNPAVAPMSENGPGAPMVTLTKKILVATCSIKNQANQYEIVNQEFLTRENIRTFGQVEYKDEPKKLSYNPNDQLF